MEQHSATPAVRRDRGISWRMARHAHVEGELVVAVPARKQAYSIKTTWRNWKMNSDERWINSMKWSWFKVSLKVEQINEYFFSDTVRSQKNKKWQWWNKPRSKGCWCRDRWQPRWFTLAPLCHGKLYSFGRGSVHHAPSVLSFWANDRDGLLSLAPRCVSLSRPRWGDDMDLTWVIRHQSVIPGECAIWSPVVLVRKERSTSNRASDCCCCCCCCCWINSFTSTVILISTQAKTRTIF